MNGENNNIIDNKLRGLKKDFILYKPDVQEVWNIALDQFEKQLVHWNNQTKLFNQKFTVMYLPCRPEVTDTGRKLLSENRLGYSKLADRIGEICNRHSIRFLNPVEYFYQSSKVQNKYFCSHLNYDGHKLLAQYFIQYYK